MIERAREYVWDTARVLEQRRFEFLFGDGDAAPPCKAALEPYRTAGRRLRLRARARRPRPDEPAAAHLDRARGARGAGRDRPGRSATTSRRWPRPTAGCRSRCRASSRTRARRGGAIGDRGHAARDGARSTRRLPGVEHPWLAQAEAFCWAAVEAIEKTHPYEVEAAITFLDAARRPRAGGSARPRGSERLVRDQELVGTQPEGYSPGEIHHAHDFAKQPGQPRPRVVQRRRDRGQPRPARRRGSATTAAGRSPGRSGRPRSRSSGPG